MKKEELEQVFAEAGNVPDLGPIEPHLALLAAERDLPELAVAMCTARIEEAAPALLAALRHVADGNAPTPAEDRLFFRGLHILGAAQQRAAWPDLVRLLRQPPDFIEELLGDTVTETLGRVVVGVFDGDGEDLFALVADPEREEFLRGTLLSAATYLTWEGRIERERMIRFLRQFYDDRPAPEGDMAWISWLEAVALLGLRDLAPLVEAVWAQGYILEGILEPKDFRKDLAEAERAPADPARFERAHIGYIDDIVAFLKRWRYYDPEELDTAGVDGARNFGEEALPWEPETPVRNPMRGVGRNDPCPCGSGKKAKKCCLA